MKGNGMKRNLFIFMLVFLLMPLFAAQQLKRLDRRYKVQYNRMYSRLSLAAKGQVVRIVRQFENQMIPLNRESEPMGTLNGVIRAAGVGNKAINAAFMVMMQATHDMDDDIRMIMAEIKAMANAKQKLRDLIKDLNQWISKEMAEHPPGAKDINNQPVSPSNTGHKSRMFKARKLFTPKYKVPYFKALLVK